ncbi:MAG: ABC transporter ATP-binding protein [Planctomycetota bacterium]|nr:ABC transporter ATP-binding protein [Planctomycetota bacterium]
MSDPAFEFARRYPPLIVRDFGRRYGQQVAVQGLSLVLPEGEILGLVGPNGAGKTTTLRSIAGVLPLQEGRVVVAGHDLEAEESVAKGCLAWVPDDPQPFDALTVWEHLEFTASLYGIADWRAKAEALLERFELAEKRGALGTELSRGMRQKLAFSCAWLSEPQLVLLDEPLSGLDPRGIRAARQAIHDLARTGVGVILSSHLLELIEALADRLLILHRGRAVFTGTLAEARADLAPDSDGSLEEIFLHATGSGADGDA